MNKNYFGAALLALSVIAPANAKDAPVTFTHEGVSYTYQVKTVSENKRIISGVATPGSSFRLVVSGDSVSGKANGKPVTFSVSHARGAASSAEPMVTVASR